MSMFGPKPGTWWFLSETDPRWNCSGHSKVGMFTMNLGASEKLEQLKQILGEPPEDLSYNYMKD